MIRAFSRAFGIDYRFYIAAALSFAFFTFLTKGRMRNRLTAGFLTSYLIILFSSTVFARPVGSDAAFRFQLFWTYGVIAKGGWKAKELAIEVLVNITMMIPFGLLLPVFIKYKQFRWTLVCGFSISVIIEVLQLSFQRGLPELDDVIHNTIGVALGFLINRMITYAVEQRRNKKKENTYD